MRLQKVTLDAICHCVPILLRRSEDPDWRYREREREEHNDVPRLLLTDQDGRIRLSQLGAGRYLLHAENFERTSNAPEWQPLRMDQDRAVTITGAAR